jgi:integrase
MVVEQYPTIHVVDPEATDPFTLLQKIPEEIVWAWVRKQIIDRAKYVAQQTGIEQIGYLADLPKPTPSPTLEEVGKLYDEKASVSREWKRTARLHWAEFCHSVNVKTLREVSQEKVVDFMDGILAASKSATYAKHRFGNVKTILTFCLKRGKWVDDAAKIRTLCAVLVPPKSASMDPHPISPEDFHKLRGAADPTMRAILLVGLNCCMYAAEVSDLRWQDIHLESGTVIADRGKTLVSRVAVLWPETVEAIKILDQKTEHLFRTSATKQRHNANTIGKAFDKLRDAQGLPHVTFSHIRDGAYTAAVEGQGVQYEHARVLAGHRIGMSDHYIKRNPRLVAGACEAIRRHYMMVPTVSAGTTGETT